jgi:hypothetical protein
LGQQFPEFNQAYADRVSIMALCQPTSAKRCRTVLRQRAESAQRQNPFELCIGRAGDNGAALAYSWLT